MQEGYSCRKKACSRIFTGLSREGNTAGLLLQQNLIDMLKKREIMSLLLCGWAVGAFAQTDAQGEAVKERAMYKIKLFGDDGRADE